MRESGFGDRSEGRVFFGKGTFPIAEGSSGGLGYMCF